MADCSILKQNKMPLVKVLSWQRVALWQKYYFRTSIAIEEGEQILPLGKVWS